MNRLTQRELQIVKLLADGLAAREISLKLSISIETVYSHKKRMFIKADCKNSTMLVAKCLKQGLI